MTEEILDLSRDPLPIDHGVEVCVIGSGSGGATAARVLAEGGREVLLLEEGGDFLGEKLTRRDELYDLLYMDGAGRMTRDMSIGVMQGRVLGGGTVINASDVVPMSDTVLRHWQKTWHLPDFAPEIMAPYRVKALEDLSANPIPEALSGRGNLVLKRGAEKLGLAGEYMQHNRVGCIGLGKCMVGCAVNAKQNTRVVSIPRALGAGARVYTRARAVRIEGAGKEQKTVVVRALDERGEAEKQTLRVRAKVVVIACNAVSTAQLLLRSGIGNEHVGEHLILQPQLFIYAVMPEELNAYRGIPQAYAVTQYEEQSEEHGCGGFRIEGIFGTPGAIASNLGRAGDFAKEVMRDYHRVAAALCLCPDLPSGRVTVSSAGWPIIDYTPRPDLHERLRKAAREAARIYLAAGAERVIVPVAKTVEVRKSSDLGLIDQIAFAPASAPLVSAHQQGTVRFAPSPKDGASNPDGEVYGTRGVYVFDSSGYPSTASSHTMAPIIASSHMLSAKLLAKLA